MLNLGTGPSRLVFPRGKRDDLNDRAALSEAAIDHALSLERAAGYVVPSGAYWKEEDRFDIGTVDRIDAAWRATLAPAAGRANF